jgi:hypothetical protein
LDNFSIKAQLKKYLIPVLKQRFSKPAYITSKYATYHRKRETQRVCVKNIRKIHAGSEIGSGPETI